MPAPRDPAPIEASVDLVASDPAAAAVVADQLTDIAELVSTGPVQVGAYTMAEMAVVLGDAPALAGSSDEALAEAVRSLVARGVLYRSGTDGRAEIVGDLGLILSLVPSRLGTLEIRRGHPSATRDEPWRWMITVLPQGVVAIDRVDPLGLHRLSLHSVKGVAETVVERLLGGPARLPREEPGPIPMTDDEARTLLAGAPMRWQLVQRVPRPEGVLLAIEAHVVRSSENQVDLLTRQPEGTGYTRIAVDADSLKEFLVGLFRRP